MTSAERALRRIKLLHTVVWAFLVVTIFAIAPLAWSGRDLAAAVCSTVVGLEVVVLAVNRWQCPMTVAAARYTDDRRANFDIYLPEWLAHHNKLIFGSVYVIAVCLSVFWRTGLLPR